MANSSFCWKSLLKINLFFITVSVSGCSGILRQGDTVEDAALQGLAKKIYIKYLEIGE